MPVINNIPNASANATAKPLIILLNFPFLIFLTSLKPPGELFRKARATAVNIVSKGAFTLPYIPSIPIGMHLLVLRKVNFMPGARASLPVTLPPRQRNTAGLNTILKQIGLLAGSAGIFACRSRHKGSHILLLAPLVPRRLCDPGDHGVAGLVIGWRIGYKYSDGEVFAVW